MGGLVETTVDERNVALLRLNRPEARNALSAEMRAEILADLERLDADPEVRCIVLAGSEKVFAAGADIRAMAERPLDAPPDPAGRVVWKGLAATETPLIAAVAGFALGGGCAQRLARAIGKQRAMEYVLTGRLFEAPTAHEWGLVNLVVKKGRWLQEALELAHTIAARAPLAVRLGKQAVLAAEETTLIPGLERERELFERAMSTEDRVEGMQAFLEKREPKFEGR